jgi:hypothetical protein
MLESFPSDSGMLRISWKADASAREAPGGFQVIVHSAISGRPIVVAVDEKGAGSGTAFVADEPRMYFISIESQGLDWSLTVEERIN